MKFLLCLWAILCLVSPLRAFAGSACYAPEQARAEQLLRLHSELMVITATCKQASDGQGLPAFYAAFTRKNLGTLKGAEKTMTAFFKSTQKGSPLEALDRLRTKLGNEFGEKIAAASAPAFCEAYRNKVVQLYSASPDEIFRLTSSMLSSAPTYVQPCETTVVVRKGR